MVSKWALTCFWGYNPFTNLLGHPRIPFLKGSNMGEMNSWCRARMAMSQEWQRTLKLLTSLVCAAKASGNLGEI